MHLWSFWANYWHFWPIWSHAQPKNNAKKVLWCFSAMLVPKLLVPFAKIRILAQKWPNFAQNLNFGQILVFRIHLVPSPTNKTMQTRCARDALLRKNSRFLGFVQTGSPPDFKTSISKRVGEPDLVLSR